jgi:hypothetical protein
MRTMPRQIASYEEVVLCEPAYIRGGRQHAPAVVGRRRVR